MKLDVNCFKCETEGIEKPADRISLYLGIKSPLCNKCIRELKGEKIFLQHIREEDELD